jgi:hypothetical protein
MQEDLEPGSVDIPIYNDAPPAVTLGTWSYYAALAVVLPVQAIPLLSLLAIIFEAWRNGSRLVRHDAHTLEKLGVLWALLEVGFIGTD